MSSIVERRVGFISSAVLIIMFRLLCLVANVLTRLFVGAQSMPRKQIRSVRRRGLFKGAGVVKLFAVRGGQRQSLVAMCSCDDAERYDVGGARPSLLVLL